MKPTILMSRSSNSFLQSSSTQLQTAIERNVQEALAEDVGSGDLTAQLVQDVTPRSAQVLCREEAVICGQPWVQAALSTLAEHMGFSASSVAWYGALAEGQCCQAGQIMGQAHGPAQVLLSAERVMLNFLQLLSGVATTTAAYVQAVAGTHTAIVDTRKTLPGLRIAQKYAVQMGGGVNHRMGLYDAILIKENHIAALGGVKAALQAAQARAPQAQFVQIEVETLAQLETALNEGAQMILLDNMPIPLIEQAVKLTGNRAVLEVSGGVTLEAVRALAQTGIHRISIGRLTKDVRAIDFSMRFENEASA
jgi:nicotinate-nucleotide pyrophosphorylase (carboxylating)